MADEGQRRNCKPEWHSSSREVFWIAETGSMHKKDGSEVNDNSLMTCGPTVHGLAY